MAKRTGQHAGTGGVVEEAVDAGEAVQVGEAGQARAEAGLAGESEQVGVVGRGAGGEAV